MTLLRFTLAQLMAVVFLFGVGFAALRSASQVWSSAVFTLTVIVLSAAILGAMGRRGRARMTWAGFALFGWIYLVTTFGLGGEGNGVTAPPHVTRWVFDYWDAQRWSYPRFESASPGEKLFSPLPPPPGLVISPDAHQFRRIGHCLTAILFGFVGAIAGRILAPRNDPPAP